MPEITDRLNELLDSTIEHNGKQISVKDALYTKLIEKAVKGDIKSMTLLLDRAYGKASDKIEVTGKDGESLGINNPHTLQEIDNRIAELIESGQNNPDKAEITD
jgi:hypothetical protein